MKVVVLFLCAILLSGCILRRRPAAASPPPAAPPPKPVAAAAPPPRVQEPLSIPQTDVRLPEPQPIPPEALATIQLPVPPAVDVPASRPGRVPGTQPPPAPRTEAEPPAPETPAPRIQTLMTPTERRRLERAIASRRRAIQQILGRTISPTAEQRDAMERINSFLTLADQAAQRGDLRQADALSARAFSLATGLK